MEKTLAELRLFISHLPFKFPPSSRNILPKNLCINPIALSAVSRDFLDSACRASRPTGFGPPPPRTLPCSPRHLLVQCGRLASSLSVLAPRPLRRRQRKGLVPLLTLYPRRCTAQPGISTSWLRGSIVTDAWLGSPALPDDILKEAVPGNTRRNEHFLSVLRRLVQYLKGRLETENDELLHIQTVCDFATLIGTYTGGFSIIIEPFDE